VIHKHANFAGLRRPGQKAEHQSARTEIKCFDHSHQKYSMKPSGSKEKEKGDGRGGHIERQLTALCPLLILTP
jgi:hypothetical protein